MYADLSATANQDIVQWSAIELSTRIHRRDVSCVEVMEAFLAQIDRLNPAVNAIVARVDAEAALEQARMRDAQLSQGRSGGWMHGFPQAPKDLAATAGLVTTMGSLALANHVPTHDSIVVERLRRQGTVLVGKTNTPEFGLGSHTYNRVYGTTGNAWAPARSAGGSSGGTAVAVALNMLPVADGSDMMGSLRNPAAWNNIYGLRPSLGRVPYGPTADVFFQQLGTEGPMARNPQDLAWLLATLAGYDPRAPLSLGDDPSCFTQPLQRDFRQTRIGWLGDLGGYLAIEPEVMAVNTRALETFHTLGCHVDAVSPFFPMDALWECWCTLRSWMVSGNLGPLYANAQTRELLKPEAIWEVEQGQRRSAADISRATATRSRWYQALLAQFAHYDFLVLPCSQVAPFPAEEPWPKTVAGRAMDTYHRWMEVVIGPTLAGVPAASLPSGFTADGLPLGLQVIAPPRSEFALLQLAAAWHEAFAPAQRRSPLLG
ncbi:Acylamidase [Ralstonia condita]|uniref:Acylamidase n=1 Tax=Ralstonia condita TaxID=3058600 RepID=A0ABN9IKL1_9RALS|nr:amidase [Ralstonia sp. LMG 7141]CAJ0782301.1 Acylamidase [Ralstonia sp. LMG 7141]